MVLSSSEIFHSSPTDPGPVPAPAAVLAPARAHPVGPALLLVPAVQDHPAPPGPPAHPDPPGLPARAGGVMTIGDAPDQSRFRLIRSLKRHCLACLTCARVVIRSKSQKRGEEKERKRRSPSPKPTKLHLGRLTRNVTKVRFKKMSEVFLV